MPRRSEMEEWIGKRLFEVDPDSGPLSRKGGVPGWVWGIVGFTGGYFTAALAAALYWRWLP
jgi:hypothetical protein